MTTTDLIGTDDVADICGVSGRTVEGWLIPLHVKGRQLREELLRPDAIVARRHIWRRSTIESWDAAGRPSMANGPWSPSLDLVGVDDIAALKGVKRRTVLSWRGSDRLPEPDVVVSGVLIWERTTIESWLAAAVSAE